MTGYGAMETELHSFSFGAIWGERSASCSTLLTPEESVCLTDGARSCVGASAGLDVLKKRKSSCIYRQSKQTSSGVQDVLFEMIMIQCIQTRRRWAKSGRKSVSTSCLLVATNTIQKNRVNFKVTGRIQLTRIEITWHDFVTFRVCKSEQILNHLTR
jgi:hypothetical protein